MFKATLILGLSLTLISVILCSCTATQIAKEEKALFETFSQRVASHMFDQSPVSYRSSIRQLAHNGAYSELSPRLVMMLVNHGYLPVDMEEADKISQRMHQGTYTEIERVEVGSADPMRGNAVPVQIFMHESVCCLRNGVEKPLNRRRHVEFLIAYQIDSQCNKVPTVVGFREYLGGSGTHQALTQKS